MVVNAIKITQKMKNKIQQSIEKDIMKCKKITERLLSKVLVSSCQSKNGLILEWPRLQFLTITASNTFNFSIRPCNIVSHYFFMIKELLVFFLRDSASISTTDGENVERDMHQTSEITGVKDLHRDTFIKNYQRDSRERDARSVNKYPSKQEDR